MSPQRIQLRRVKGWRKPKGAVVVSRPSKWGNPFEVVPPKKSALHERADDLGLPAVTGWSVRGNGTHSWSADDDHPWTREDAHRFAVDRYREWLRPRTIRARDAEIELGGKDLACWCPLDQPCHVDWLLAIANPDKAS